jgi:ATP-dependent RNA helicase DeaD
MGTGFESFGLEPPLLKAVREMGFSEPFPIQALAISPLRESRDLMGQAHTGAGKTLAFALPMLQKMDRQTPGVQGLVIVPTRELALQVAREFEKLAKHLLVSVAAIYAGASMRLQIGRLRNRSCSIVIATPGRLRMGQTGVSAVGLRDVRAFQRTWSLFSGEPLDCKPTDEAA